MELLDPTMCLRIPMIDSLGTVQVDFGHLWIRPLGKSQAAVQVWTGPRKALVAGPGNTANGSTNQSKADDHLILSTNQRPMFAGQWGSRWSGVNITAAKTAGGESCSFSGFKYTKTQIQINKDANTNIQAMGVEWSDVNITAAETAKGESYSFAFFNDDYHDKEENKE